MHEYKLMSKQIRLSAVFGQQHKEETAEMSTEHDEAECENDQSSEPKSKLLRADVCKYRANGGHGQKLKFAHILSIVRY